MVSQDSAIDPTQIEGSRNEGAARPSAARASCLQTGLGNQAGCVLPPDARIGANYLPLKCVLKGSDGDGVDHLHEPCCASDGGWPSGLAVQAESPNHCKLRRSRAGVVSVAEKARQERVRCATRRRTCVNHCGRIERIERWHHKRIKSKVGFLWFDGHPPSGAPPGKDVQNGDHGTEEAPFA